MEPDDRCEAHVWALLEFRGGHGLAFLLLVSRIERVHGRLAFGLAARQIA